MPTRGNFDVRLDIDLITKKSECRPERLAKFFLEFFDFLYRSPAELRRDAGQTLVGVVSGECNRHYGGGDHFWIMGCQVPQRLFEDRTVIDLGAKHDLGMDLDIVIEQPLKLVENI